ncbi:hypothetical protein [Streptomyces spectabilis]|uniref:Uncharacterized protein n=1 Tax=Streptomyces spectabilis TaxID=68270 RepID=A0A5P2XP68_STRST|nr:hypothetical protein [Streptomyces spectabilis]MBB5102582.1 hypothetical protein [Streptomyces spectabilis]MCI3907621.1 hypothetical protein [Streptomyces spectabilis]QEV64306.1 hypothetical protein CP982_41105 [Streptomyces spectabilis]
MAQITSALPHTGALADIAAKYDRITELVERDAADHVTETDLLAALLLTRLLRDKLLTDESRLIAAARHQNVIWSRIATALELRTRQAAERRYLQLRRDQDDIVGHPLTQSERVEAVRTHRDRHAEQRWAVAHRSEITALARRFAAVPHLQQRADRCPRATRANAVAALHAHRSGEPDPAPLRSAWPARLAEAVRAEAAHRAAQQRHLPRIEDLQDPERSAPPDPDRLTAAQQDHLIHEMFGLIGYAVDSDSVDLDDHPELVTAIRALYAEAGSHAPRAPEDYAPRPHR